MRIQVNEDIKPVTEFRANSAALIEQVRRTGRPLVLTQRGQTAAVLLDPERYEALLEELEMLRDIERAETELKAGDVVPHAEARLRAVARFEA